MAQNWRDAELPLFAAAKRINDPERARLLARWGVDAICRDRIDLIGAGFIEQDARPD